MTDTGTLEVVTCWCGVAHAVPKQMRNQQRREHADGREQTAIYCPLGHAHIIAGEPPARDS